MMIWFTTDFEISVPKVDLGTRLVQFPHLLWTFFLTLSLSQVDVNPSMRVSFESPSYVYSSRQKETERSDGQLSPFSSSCHFSLYLVFDREEKVETCNDTFFLLDCLQWTLPPLHFISFSHSIVSFLGCVCPPSSLISFTWIFSSSSYSS